jgi:hypothetical protein
VAVKKFIIKQKNLKTMKTATFKSKNSFFDGLRRFICLFQVMIVGIAIPLLFHYSISDRAEKQGNETIVKEISNSSPQNPVNVYPYNEPEI